MDVLLIVLKISNFFISLFFCWVLLDVCIEDTDRGRKHWGYIFLEWFLFLWVTVVMAFNFIRMLEG